MPEWLIVLVLALTAWSFFWAQRTGRTRLLGLPTSRDEFRMHPEGLIDEEAGGIGPQGAPVAGTRRMLNEAGFHSISNAEYWGASVLAGLAIGAAVLVVTHGGILAVASGIVGSGLPRFYVKRRIQKLREKLEHQLEAAAQSVSYQMKAGNALTTALESLAETDAPLGPEFERLLMSVRAGKPLTDALIEVRDRLAHEGMDLMTVAMIVHLETGSELAPILLNISGVLRRNIELRASIRAKFSQPQASYFFVAGLSLPIFGFWFLQRPDLAFGLYSSPVGQILILLLIGWAYLGYKIMTSLASLEAAL